MDNARPEELAAFFLLGASVGAGAALLMAPASGKRTRRRLGQERGQVADVLIDARRKVVERCEHLHARLGELSNLITLNEELEGLGYSLLDNFRASLRGIDTSSVALLQHWADMLSPRETDHLRGICVATAQMVQVINGLLGATSSRTGEPDRDHEQVDYPVAAVSSSAVGGDRQVLRVNVDTELAERCADLYDRSVNLSEVIATNQELESLCYSIAHDLRAPLRSIDGFSLALLEDCADRLEPGEKLHLGRIRAASARMGQLIDDLLGFARMARRELILETVDLSRLAQEVVASLQMSEPLRDATVTVTPNLNVEGDRHLLRVLLENLLGNAWKFSSKQAFSRIEFGTIQACATEKAYFVRDNGAGFDMRYADKLFGAFQRLHDANEFTGNGLGLASAQRIVRRHGGRIWAESAIGHGATFCFVLDTHVAGHRPQVAS
jgi:light-regulated signal transduction histidine kinase (bacteriophytochrome)